MKELCDLYTPPVNDGRVNLRGLGWAGHVAWIGGEAVSWKTVNNMEEHINVDLKDNIVRVENGWN
jgi:hypothetical protein